MQDNLKKLEYYGYEVISPAVGYLACGDTGAGKMPEPELLLEYILKEVAREKDMRGLKVLVTAGPTQEAVDPVRYITNHSTGRMGYAIARGLHAERCRGYACHRTVSTEEAGVCEGCAGYDSEGDV